MKQSEIRCLEKTEAKMDCYLLGPFLMKDGGEFNVPFISTETPVVIAVNRGRKVIEMSGGVAYVKIKRDEMTRAPLIETISEDVARKLQERIISDFSKLQEIASLTTRFGRLTSVDPLVFGKDLYLRVGMFCGDAAGSNMTEKAAIAISEYLANLREFRGKVSLLSVSSNYCVDKKPAKVNLVKGRGKRVFAEIKIPRRVIEEKLKTTPERIQSLNYKKNYTGSRLAGCLGGKNSHHANMIAAIFLATGQDMANVVEASMGSTQAIVEGDSLIFSVDIPCLIVGTVGGGIRFPYAKANLEKMGCAGGGDPVGSNARDFAKKIAIAVLAGELSTMAELTKGGEFIKAHLKYERGEI